MQKCKVIAQTAGKAVCTGTSGAVYRHDGFVIDLVVVLDFD